MKLFAHVLLAAALGASASAALAADAPAAAPAAAAKPAKPDHVGLVLPNKFVVGVGMDAYGYWRNLPGIWALDI